MAPPAWIRPFRRGLRFTYNTVFAPLHWQLARRAFDAQLAAAQSLEARVALMWSFRGYGYYHGLYPNQDRAEILALAQRLRALEPRVIVELGTRDGGTLFLWTQCSEHTRLVVSIDLPGGIHGGGYPAPRSRLYRHFVANRPGCELHLLRVDSQQPAARAALVRTLKGRPIDFLFIDADHRYEGVKCDYERYRDLVRPGGLIAFHDIRPNRKDPTIQVYRLWDELRTSGANTEEIIHEPYQGRYGIGLLWQT